MNKLAFLFFLLLIPTSFAFAEEVTMTSEQSDYYFKTGDDAVIPVEIENSSGNAISGTLQYTITQDIQQGNTRISNTNSNFSTLTAEEGKRTISLDFGSFSSPTTITTNLKFNYNNGNETNVFLGPIKIIFVDDTSQMTNSSKPMQSSSQQGSPQNNQMNPQQSLQQRLDEMLNQSPLSQDPQQRLQNNQMAQDSSTLKQEIQDQLNKDNQLKSELEKQITSNPEFQKLHQQLLDQGYELKKGSLHPVTNSTGTFEANYENQDGKWGKIQGAMTNGTMTDIQMQTQEHQENLLAQLRADPTFQEYEKQLNQEGFSEQNFSISSNANQTSVLVEFQDKDSKKATITGDFVNEELVEVKLDKPTSNQFDILPFLVIGIIAVAAAVLYIKLRSRKKTPLKEIPIPVVERYDYVSEATKLLEKSKEEFKSQRYQDAYSFLGQAIRLFLSHKFELKKEITNEELFDFLKDPSYPVDAIKKYLNHSTLVEFAKNSPDENEFKNMIVLTESLFKK